MQRRYSRQREMILRWVSGTTEHPTAEMVYQGLKPEEPSLSRGTVYRNLNLLAEEGKLERMPLPVERYDARTEPHPHFQCRCCGRISDLSLPYQEELDRAAAEQIGARVLRHDLFFYGVCAQCQAEEGSAAEG